MNRCAARVLNLILPEVRSRGGYWVAGPVVLGRTWYSGKYLMTG